MESAVAERSDDTRWARVVAKTASEFANSIVELSPVLVWDSGQGRGIESGVALCFPPHSTGMELASPRFAQTEFGWCRGAGSST